MEVGTKPGAGVLSENGCGDVVSVDREGVRGGVLTQGEVGGLRRSEEAGCEQGAGETQGSSHHEMIREKVSVG